MKTAPLILVLFVFLGNFLFAQEDCVDGIDNDGDGLIDLNDPDGCSCEPSDGQEFIYNGNFEEYFACPNSFSGFPVTSETDQTPYTNYFVNGGSTDYFNSCGYIGGNLVPEVTPMLGGTNGEGIVGFFFDGDSVGGYREYITQCLQVALQPGVEYTMSFEVANSGFYESDVGTNVSVLTECSSLPMGLYGYPDCPYDIGLNNYNDCLSEAGDYISLLEMEVEVMTFEFTEYTFTFTVPEPITSLSIGPGCSNPSCVGVNDPDLFNSNFFYFDNWSVTTAASSGIETPTFEVEGNTCTGFTFTAEEGDFGSYQWYVNGIAAQGQTNLTLSLPPDSLPTIILGAFGIDAEGNQACSFSDPFEPEIESAFTVQADFEEILCPDQETTIAISIFPEGNYDFLWSTGETTQSITAVIGDYELTVTDPNSQCSESLSFSIESCEEQVLFVSLQDQAICQGESVVIEATVEGDNPPFTYEWNPPLGNGPGPFTLNPASNQTYSLMVTDDVGNSVETTATVTVFDENEGEFELGADTLICGENLVIGPENPLPQINYQWNTGEEEPTISVTSSGVYSLTAATPCNTFFDEIEVEFPDSELIPVLPDTLFYCRDSIARISLSVPGFVEPIWSDGVVGGSREFTSEGRYEVIFETDCGSEVRQVAVAEVNCGCPIYIPNAFSPNEDGLNDVFKIDYDCQFETFEIRIFNRWGGEVFKSNNPDFVWRGANNGNDYYSGTSIFTYRLEALPQPSLVLPDPIVITGNISAVR